MIPDQQGLEHFTAVIVDLAEANAALAVDRNHRPRPGCTDLVLIEGHDVDTDATGPGQAPVQQQVPGERQGPAHCA
ncbi:MULTISPECIES: hypothetical protein [unclassified Crossiella]|uniref:hypothetical protein n=1 Tax=unclassified Crossiella TaxID=2620835 RepID=UPI001FFF7F83|nr:MULTISPECIES: hypothetical protein [unclassified Crossiella]MCK2242341.1 hypothetical protein [Crossiella sp. S99.2]MCK2254628.1 hypothetical protein [Crossiella sp. S99.1]